MKTVKNVLDTFQPKHTLTDQTVVDCLREIYEAIEKLSTIPDVQPTKPTTTTASSTPLNPVQKPKW